MSLERYEEALSDLKKVRCLAPKEAAVHFQLGKVYMKLQRDRKALLHFNIAMDLNRDSKDYHTIKTHIERLHIRGVREPDADGSGADGSTGAPGPGFGAATKTKPQASNSTSAGGYATAATGMSSPSRQANNGTASSPSARSAAGDTSA